MWDSKTLVRVKQICLATFCYSFLYNTIVNVSICLIHSRMLRSRIIIKYYELPLCIFSGGVCWWLKKSNLDVYVSKCCTNLMTPTLSIVNDFLHNTGNFSYVSRLCNLKSVEWALTLQSVFSMLLCSPSDDRWVWHSQGMAGWHRGSALKGARC